MARKPKHEEHENHERWLVSYADFITLLFAFFVVMYSVSSVNEGKYRVLSDAIVAAFQQSQKSLKPIQIGTTARSPQKASLDFTDTAHPIKTPESPFSQKSRANKYQGEHKEDEADFSEFPMAAERMLKEGEGSDQGKSDSSLAGLSEAQLSAIANEIEAAMQPLIDRDLISVKRNKRWIEVEINTDILFASGSARMQPQSIPILEAISRILAAFPNDIRVEGFTDNVAIKSTAYPSNWELSAARASSVVRLFSVHGVEPERMAAIGYGEFRPLVSNETLEGRVKNRRVMVVITANRHMKRPKPVEKEEVIETEDDIAEPEIEIAELEPDSAESEADARIKADFLRLDALISSSGLHRTTPISVDELRPSAIMVPGSSQAELLSPIWIPGVNIRASLSAPIGLPPGRR